jgi:GrpB-like predicted nucleotidyltransferase (UPF0157 family)
VSHPTEEGAFETWRQLRLTRGESVTAIDLYELVARSRGIEPEQLSVDERRSLAVRALKVMDGRFEFISGSDRPEPEPIELVPYDAGWASQFEHWKKRLVAALPTAPRRIEHVGSTSIPGLAAKPVVDIQVSVDDPEDEAKYVPAIESLGVQLRNRDSEHRFFRPYAGRTRDIHIHVCLVGSLWERRHIVFRDYLRANATARHAYLQAKEAEAARWRDDRIAYTEAKSETIQSLTRAAEEWARDSGWSLPEELGEELPQRPGEEDRDG